MNVECLAESHLAPMSCLTMLKFQEQLMKYLSSTLLFWNFRIIMSRDNVGQRKLIRGGKDKRVFALCKTSCSKLCALKIYVRAFPSPPRELSLSYGWSFRISLQKTTPLKWCTGERTTGWWVQMRWPATRKFIMKNERVVERKEKQGTLVLMLENLSTTKWQKVTNST